MHKSHGKGKEPHTNLTTTQNKMIHKGIEKLTFYHNNNRSLIQEMGTLPHHPISNHSKKLSLDATLPVPTSRNQRLDVLGDTKGSYGNQTNKNSSRGQTLFSL